jgi:AcrR family transcriptional regulator
MTVFAGQGDPGRTMALLWRTPDQAPAGGPGPKRGLTVDAVVRAAIEVADTVGLEQLSMRTVGERLGTSAMALYTYVPSKRELIDLMYDEAHAGFARSYRLGAGWRPAVAQWAVDLWNLYLAHPWVLQVSFARPVLGPHEQAVLESLLRILEPVDLPAATVAGAVTSLFNLVRGAAATVAEARAASAATGMSDDQWWAARAGSLAAVVPDFAERFPMTAALGAASQPVEPGEPYLETLASRSLTTGLSLLLDGISAQ